MWAVAVAEGEKVLINLGSVSYIKINTAEAKGPDGKASGKTLTVDAYVPINGTVVSVTLASVSTPSPYEEAGADEQQEQEKAEALVKAYWAQVVDAINSNDNKVLDLTNPIKTLKTAPSQEFIIGGSRQNGTTLR